MLKYCVNSIPDLTLSKYQVFADSGVDGMIEAQIQFIKQLHRVSLLGKVSIHFFFDYDPSRLEGQKLKIELVFNGLEQNNPYNDKLRKVINSSGISKYFSLREELYDYSSKPEYTNMAVMYKICLKCDEYTVYICNYFTIYRQECGEFCRIFICVFIAYTNCAAHILSLKQSQ